MKPGAETMRRDAVLLPKCWVAASVGTLLAGVIMVLVFSRVLIVPYLLTKDYVATDCVVSSIELMDSVENVSCEKVGEVETAGDWEENQTLCSSHPNITALEPGRVVRTEGDGRVSGLCVHVKVFYRAFDGLVRKATLQAFPRDSSQIGADSLIQSNVSKFKLTFSPIASHCRSIISLLFVPVTRAASSPFSRDAFTITSISSRLQCLCHSCNAFEEKAKSMVHFMDKRLYIGSQIQCYYQTSGATYLLKWETSNSTVLHSILWPTVVFIGGFISLFFSCIALLKEKQTGQLTHKKMSTASIEY